MLEIKVKQQNFFSMAVVIISFERLSRNFIAGTMKMNLTLMSDKKNLLS